MRKVVNPLMLLIALILLPNIVSAQKTSYEKEVVATNKKTQKDTETFMQYSPYVMKVKIKRLSNEKSVVSSVVIEDKNDVEESQKPKEITRILISKEEGLELRKRKRKNNKVTID